MNPQNGERIRRPNPMLAILPIAAVLSYFPSGLGSQGRTRTIRAGERRQGRGCTPWVCFHAPAAEEGTGVPVRALGRTNDTVTTAATESSSPVGGLGGGGGGGAIRAPP